MYGCFDGEGMVRAWPLEYLLEVVRSTLGGRPTTFPLGSGHEQAPVSLLVVLVWVVGGTLAGILVLLCLALRAVKNRSDRFLAQGVAGHDVEELLGGSWVLTS